MADRATGTRIPRAKFQLGRITSRALIGTILLSYPAGFDAQSAAAQAQAAQAPASTSAPSPPPSAQPAKMPDWQMAAGGKMEFDVASVKQNKSGLPPSGSHPHSNVPLYPGSAYSPNGGLFSATNEPVGFYISFAYKLDYLQLQFVVLGLPAWANSDRFDIEARAQGNPTKDQMRVMIQSLLADRFKLVAHYETRQKS
jgi:hypothetical protein